jgi:hypothetical protein
MAFVTRREDVLERDSWHGFPEFLDFSQCAIDFCPAAIGFRNQPSDPLAVTRDDDALTAFNLIEEAWQVRLGLRCLNFAHDYTIDQSN